ncbi:hypothetical protein GCM10009119_42690 [Algoriphagus jejuensis]|uniref:YtxH-like protein n=1 Tax=Algoriphagus jejuensis TaxID=419934 RepID=A0ABP3YI78_9BACT
MTTSKKTMTYWLAGLASGLAAGYFLYQNREKIGPQKDKLVKLLGELQKTSEDIGKKLKAAGLESLEKGLEKGKVLAKNAGEHIN